MRDHYLVSYDISDPVRLRKVHRVVRDFGDPLQLSVFSCQLSRKDLAVLEGRLLDVIDQREDQVVFVGLGRVKDGETTPPRCRALGRAIDGGIGKVVVI
ncbi:MAG: CRISPR-associated endonuclease Cas2 [Nannocystaceae bacterium]